MDDDLKKYVEFLQRQLLTAGAEDVFNAARAVSALAERADHLRGVWRRQTGHGEVVDDLAQMQAAFMPETPYEVPQTSAIFQPLVTDITATARRCGIRPIRDVRVLTSTDLRATPYSRPAPAGEHLLFIGFGTSAFCNYWAKAYTALLHVLAEYDLKSSCTGRDHLEKALKTDPRPLLLAQRLAFHYAAHDSLVGFGEVELPPTHLGYRLQLLHAMELFIVAHEFSHFVVEERFPMWQGSLEAEQVHASELFCDELGFSLSRQAAAAVESFDAFTGVGALVFFRAMELSLAIRERVTRAAVESDGHPSLETRIELLRELVRSRTAPDQAGRAVAFLDEYDVIATSLRDVLLGFMDEAPGANPCTESTAE